MANFLKMGNDEIWEAIRQYSPQFASTTSKLTKAQFTQASFEQMTNQNPGLVDTFMNLLIRVYLQEVKGSSIRDNLLENGFGEEYGLPYGAIAQRIMVDEVKPVSPGWKNIVNGGTLDPFVISQPDQQERFYKMNFDYQALLTVRDMEQFKVAFTSPENGFATLMGIYLQQLENSYKLQRYFNKLEAINAGLSSSTYPLKTTQIREIVVSDTPTQEQLVDMLLNIKNTISAMCTAPNTGAFNALGFKHYQEKSRLRLLMRRGWKNLISTKVLATVYNPEKLALDIDIIEVDNFGGLKPYKESAYTTPLYEVYNGLGQVIGYAETANATTPTITDDTQVFWKDPHADTIGIIADKGWMFESIQNPYTVEPIRNPRGCYMNFWARSMGNGIHIDNSYNVVKLNAVEPEEPEVEG